MTNMTLAGSNITLDLNGLDATGRGMGVRRGVTGFGMPPVAARWIEGALDGATFRGRRVLPRDIDLPLTIVGSDHADLRRWLDTLATVLSDPIVRLTVTEDDGSVWWIDASWVGGGDYSLGIETFSRGADDTEVDTVVTLRAGDPFWTNDTASSLVIGDMAVFGGRQDPFLDGLVHLPLVSSQVTGEIDLENLGNAESFPLWEITGPGSNFEARLGDQVFRWEGELAAGETLTIDARTALVQDGEGENRYAELDTAPRFWTIPPGTSRAEVGMEDTSTGELITEDEILRTNLVVQPRNNPGGNVGVWGGQLGALVTREFTNTPFAATAVITGRRSLSPMPAGSMPDVLMDITAHNLPVSPGEAISGGAWVFPSHDITLWIQHQWLGTQGANSQGSNNGTPTLCPANQWTLITNEGAVAPAGANWVRLDIDGTGNGFPEGFELFAARWRERGPALGPYFDGSMPATLAGDPVWVGAADNSHTNLFRTRLHGVSRIAVSWRARKWVNI